MGSASGDDARAVARRGEKERGGRWRGRRQDIKASSLPSGGSEEGTKSLRCGDVGVGGRRNGGGKARVKRRNAESDEG